MSEQLGRALMHPLRRRLLFEYTGGPTSPGTLARRLGEPVNRVAYHTRVLARHGLVEAAGTARRRGALTHFYRASVTPAIDGTDWESLPATVRRALTLGALDQATTEARRAALSGGFDGREVQLTRSLLALDDEGVGALAALLRGAFEEIGAIVAASAARDSAERLPCEVVVLAYERVDRPFPD